ncbi:DUF2953 domain-containing protein [Acetivibrio cellulolyticus]|uniref:DUF2953 domain-containing protein n=1 Tax=Acetivibrio cellulolyticus TaxID=35830 RepID=UPI0002481C26|nr:DUF2953 domain-containing protein [Acetivibrio cellulolyticus]
MIILEILGYMLIALFVLLALILILPIEFKVYGQKYEKIFFKASLIWFMGALGFHFMKEYSQEAAIYVRIFGFKKKIDGSKFAKKDNKKEKKDEKKKEKKKEKGKSRNYLESNFIRCALECLKKVLNHIKPKKFVIEGKVGFEDPYVTGLLCTVLNLLYAELKKANINVRTVFDDEIYEGKCLIQGRVVLAYLAYIALRLYFSRPVSINKKQKFKEVKSYGN